MTTIQKGNRLPCEDSLSLSRFPLVLRTRGIADTTWICGWRRGCRCLVWGRCTRGGGLSGSRLGGNADGWSGDHHLTPTVLLAACGSSVVCHWIAHAVAHCADVLCRNALRYEEALHRA